MYKHVRSILLSMVAERDTPATAAAPLTAQRPPPQIGMTAKRGTLPLSGRVLYRSAVENTATQRYRSAVIAEREVGTAEKMPPFAKLIPLSAVNGHSAEKS